MESMKHRSNFVEDYAPYRPSYPRELLNKLKTIAQLGPALRRRGCRLGTGILTRQLLESGARVIGIEPNAAMRDAADRDLLGHPRFDSRAACAEATGLPNASVDLITAAQAFHWFDPAPTRAEFVRILRPGGRSQFCGTRATIRP